MSEERNTADNSTFAIAGVSVFVSSSMKGYNFVFRNQIELKAFKIKWIKEV